MIGPRTLAYTKALERKVAKKAAPVAKLTRRVGSLAKQVNGDLNWVNIDAGPIQVSSSGAIIGLSDLAQGQGTGFRDGTTQVIKSLRLKVATTATATATPGVYNPSTVRVIVYLDKENTIPAASTLLHVTGTSAAVVSSYNQLNRHKFIVLYDKLRKMGANDPEAFFSISVNLKNRQTKYTSTTNASANGNVVKMCIISASSGAFAPNYTYSGRLFFMS